MRDRSTSSGRSSNAARTAWLQVTRRTAGMESATARPGQLVPESDPVLADGHHTAPLGRGQSGQTARHDRVHQPSLHRGGDDRELLEGIAAGPVQST